MITAQTQLALSAIFWQSNGGGGGGSRKDSKTKTINHKPEEQPNLLDSNLRHHIRHHNSRAINHSTNSRQIYTNVNVKMAGRNQGQSFMPTSSVRVDYQFFVVCIYFKRPPLLPQRWEAAVEEIMALTFTSTTRQNNALHPSLAVINLAPLSSSFQDHSHTFNPIFFQNNVL